MDLSIIIPVFNVENYLAECLDSIYSIDGMNREIIIVNDGSTDSSQKIIDKYKTKYPSETKIIIQENKGLSGARNAGLIEAEGEYVTFIDSDDYIDAKKYSMLFKEGKELDLDIIFGEYKYYCNNNCYMTKPMKERMRKLTRLDVCTGLEFWESSFEKKHDSIRVEVVTNIFKREMLNYYNLLFVEKLLHEDTLFMYKAIYHAKKVKYYPIDFYFYRIREGSIMSVLNYKNYMHKIYIAKELQQFKEENSINLYSWDSIIFSLYFGALRKCRIKNKALYMKIKENKKLTKNSKIKKILIFFYHIALRDTEINIYNPK